MLRGAAGTAPRRHEDWGGGPPPATRLVRVAPWGAGTKVVAGAQPPPATRLVRVAPVLALALGCALAGPAVAQSTDAGRERFAFTGRLHWDAAVYRRGAGNARGGAVETRTLLRRARLGARGAEGRFSWLFVVDADAAGGGPARAVEIEDAAVHYSPSDRLRLGVGRMKIPVTFQESASSNDMAFIERPLPVDAFTDGTLGPRVTNAQVWIHGRNHLVEAAVHLARDGGGAPRADARGKSVGVTGRAVLAPVRTATGALHLGGWVDRSGGPVGEAVWGYGAELDAADVPALTGRRPEGRLRALVHGGLEAAWLDGPLWAQTEVMGGRFGRADGGSHAAGGWYVQVGYVVGGARSYDMREGTWSGTAVAEAVTAGGRGAVELALRYSTLDFGRPVNATEARPAGDAGHAGRQSNVTAGVNWYLTGRSRLMFNAVHVDLDGAFDHRRGHRGGDPARAWYAAPVTGTFRVYGLRWQYHW